MLYIKIIKLNVNVKDQDLFSKNDLYVKIIYGNQIRRTTVKWNNDDPIWNEAFIFDFVAGEHVKFEIYDENSWSPGAKLYEHSFQPEMNNVSFMKKNIFDIEMGNIHNSEKCKLERMGQILEGVINENDEFKTKLEGIKQLIN